MSYSYGSSQSNYLRVPSGTRMPSGVVSIRQIGAFKVVKFAATWTMRVVAGGVEATRAINNGTQTYVFSNSQICDANGNSGPVMVAAPAPAPVYVAPAPAPVYVVPGAVMLHGGHVAVVQRQVVLLGGHVAVVQPQPQVVLPGGVVQRGQRVSANPYGLLAPVGNWRC